MCVTFTYYDRYFNIRQVRQILSDYFKNIDDEHNKVIFLQYINLKTTTILLFFADF